MILARLVFLILILGAVLYFSLNRPLLTSLSLKVPYSSLPQALKDILGLGSSLNQIDLKNLPQQGLDLLTKDLPSQILNELPKQIEQNLPKIEEIITNRQKEELYLKAPLSFNLPDVRVENFDQEISVLLEPFEVKDSRKGDEPWTLRISARDLAAEKGRISAENIRFQLKETYIDAAESNQAELKIEEGASLKITAEPGRGKGLFKIRPLVVVKIPQESYSGTYRAEVESKLE